MLLCADKHSDFYTNLNANDDSNRHTDRNANRHAICHTDIDSNPDKYTNRCPRYKPNRDHPCSGRSYICPR